VWYAIQAIIALGVAFYWTTLPGNDPSNFGHGLFLGGIVAWFATTIIYATLDLFNRRKRRIQSLPRLLVDRRGQKKPSNQIGVRRSVRSRHPTLIP
jgi:hypothetical protein